MDARRHHACRYGLRPPRLVLAALLLGLAGAVAGLCSALPNHALRHIGAQSSPVQQTLAPDSSAVFTLPSGATVRVDNRTGVTIVATLDGTILTVIAPPPTALMAVPTCDRPTGQLNGLRCDFAAGAPLVLPLIDLNRPPQAATPTPLPTPPPCPPSGPCSAILFGGQRLTIAGIIEVVVDEHAGTFLVRFDGMSLTISGNDPSGLMSLQASPDTGCRSVNGLWNVVRCTHPHGVLELQGPFRNPAGATCTTATLPAGWNLVSGNVAAELTTNSGPLYTYSPREEVYTAMAGTTTPWPSDAYTAGYWAYFDVPPEVFLGCTLPTPLRLRMPPVPLTRTIDAGWSLIGLDCRGAVLVGADEVLTYDPTADAYGATDALPPGEGAWVYSETGGTLTCTPPG